MVQLLVEPIIEWLGLEGTSRIIKLQHPCCTAGLSSFTFNTRTPPVNLHHSQYGEWDNWSVCDGGGTELVSNGEKGGTSPGAVTLFQVGVSNLVHLDWMYAQLGAPEMGACPLLLSSSCMEISISVPDHCECCLAQLCWLHLWPICNAP